MHTEEEKHVASNSRELARKHHQQLMAAHYDRMRQSAADLALWFNQIEAAHHEHYSFMARDLQESTDPEDEALFDKIDKEYADRLSSLQAARERFAETLAHAKCALVSGKSDDILRNITPETFK